MINAMKIFLSIPISCFDNASELQKYKADVSSLIATLKENHSVCSEIESISDDSDYDTPEKSISTDLDSIRECDIFILHYPKKVPTSALIELGFAIAFNKRIVIITPQKNILPYLVNVISAINNESLIIESTIIDDELVQKIDSLL